MWSRDRVKGELLLALFVPQMEKRIEGEDDLLSRFRCTYHPQTSLGGKVFHWKAWGGQVAREGLQMTPTGRPSQISTQSDVQALYCGRKMSKTDCKLPGSMLKLVNSNSISEFWGAKIMKVQTPSQTVQRDPRPLNRDPLEEADLKSGPESGPRPPPSV
ncbi:hypothetical protein INR49_005494 [Caranx melampygus]|nr:hypothetical protein INR49_005494 [Caranx melampygus]